jgi:hypothetical protein
MARLDALGRLSVVAGADCSVVAGADCSVVAGAAPRTMLRVASGVGTVLLDTSGPRGGFGT